MPQVQSLPIPQDLIAGNTSPRSQGPLGAWFVVATLCALGAPATLRAQHAAPAAIEVILDNGAAMAGSDGAERTRTSLARTYLAALRRALDDDGHEGTIVVRTYGGETTVGGPSCRVSERLAPPSDPATAWDAAVSALEPAGPSPLAYALAEAMRDSFTTYILIASGADGCGEDACARWSALSADHHARIHVVALDVPPEAADRLHCVSRAGQGSFSEVVDAASAEAAARRLAMIFKNEGVLDVAFTIGDGPRFAVPVRVVRPLTKELVVAYTARGPRHLGAGMYAVTVGTIPPTVFDRVLVLPGDTARVGGTEFGKLSVDVRDNGDAPLHAAVTVRHATGGPDLRFFTTGDTIVLGSGSYDVRVDLGDSLAVRKGVVVSRGAATEVAFGGSGALTILAPEFATPPSTRALVSRGGVVDTLEVGTPSRLPVGEYRLVVQSVPVYVSEHIVIERDEETLLTLPTTGILGVDLEGVDGPRTDIRVEVIEPLTGEVYGLLMTGERRLVMPGTYNLALSTIPPRTLTDIVVEPGASRIVALGGLSAIIVADSASAGGSLRLEVLTIDGARGLGEATGRAPGLPVWAGSYLVRVWGAADLAWEGLVTVAEGERARIDFDGP